MAATFLGPQGADGQGRAAGTHGNTVETPRAVRLFLLKALLFAAVWGALFFRGEWQRYGYWMGAWAAVAAVGLLLPAPFRPLRRAVIRLGAFLGRALSWLALASIYWLVLVPVSLAARSAGKRFLEKGRDAEAETYWLRRDPAPQDKASWERQF